jgi:hypothetical protein
MENPSALTWFYSSERMSEYQNYDVSWTSPPTRRGHADTGLGALEARLGFERGHALNGLGPNERKSETCCDDWERRCDKYSCHCPSLSLLVEDYLFRCGFLPSAPGRDVAEGRLFDEEKRRLLEYVKCWKDGWSLEMEAVLDLHRRAMHRGADVRMGAGYLASPTVFPRRAINPLRWKWRVVASYPRATGEHINVLELHAVLVAIRWRLKQKSGIMQRFAHLIDSQVSQSALSNGRSSSRKVSHELNRIMCLLLASGLTPAL